MIGMEFTPERCVEEEWHKVSFEAVIVKLFLAAQGCGAQSRSTGIITIRRKI